MHFAQMRRYHANASVAANDDDCYRANDVPGSFYIQNTWIDLHGCRILGKVGKLGAITNTLGIETLGGDVLPQSRRSMQTKPFEIHILGGAAERPEVARLLEEPEVKLCGFVDDIDEEILRANLHARTRGSYPVIHADAALSMPEIRHRDNVLMERDAPEIADLVAEAAAHPKFLLRLGEAGDQTYRRIFTGGTVVHIVANRLRDTYASRPAL